MAGTHGELYSEIGKLVLAAHAGQTIDLTHKSQELAHRYVNLGVPADSIARAIARSLGAVSVSMAIVRSANEVVQPDEVVDDEDSVTLSSTELFPSGVRLAMLS